VYKSNKSTSTKYKSNLGFRHLLACYFEMEQDVKSKTVLYKTAVMLYYLKEYCMYVCIKYL